MPKGFSFVNLSTVDKNEPDLSKRNKWVKLLSPEEASKIREAADSLVRSVRRQN
nr:hypothetical protein [Butyrivibrio sp. WCD3002]